MRAFTLSSFDSPPALRDDLAAPTAADGEVLVRVQGSSVNPADAAIASGMLKGMFAHEFPVLLGRDYAGVVEQVGPGATRHSAGDEVFGFLRHADPTVRAGTWAEQIVVPDGQSIARKPASLDFATAGAAPLAGVTALQCVDALHVGHGDIVLIVGATGGVGSLAVQLVVLAGAAVLAPALPEDDEYLRELGVSDVLERDGDVAAAVRERHPDGVDALLDLVSNSPDGFDAHAAALKAGGRGATPLGAAGEGPGRSNIMAVPSPENLDRLARLLDGGTLKVSIMDSFGLERAGDALSALGSTHTRGKLAIQIA